MIDLYILFICFLKAKKNEEENFNFSQSFSSTCRVIYTVSVRMLCAKVYIYRGICTQDLHTNRLHI